MPSAGTWMDLEITILSEVREREINIRQIEYYLHVKSKKMIQMNLFRKQKLTHRLRKQTYSYQRGNIVKRNRLGVWD